MKCPTCGAENEAGNRFCEQCGSRMEPSGNFPQAQVALASQPTAAGPACPSCGAAVLPGEAFCDECGASLTAAAPTALPVVSNDAPTMIAPPPPAADAAAAGVATKICPACGQSNVATDRFCDHCGATLDAPPASVSASATSAPVAADAPPAMSDSDLLQSLNTAPPALAEPDADAVTVTTETSSPDAQPSTASTTAEAPTIEQPMLAPAADVAPVADVAQAAYEAEQKRLNEEIERQQKIIAQFEQMQTMFGAAAPAAVTQGLAEARDAQARAEADLAALQPPAPPAPQVDPVEVARLNEEIERQQKIIAQFEQMQTMFGAATPAAVTQGLAEARDAQARAETDLATLTGGSVATPPVAAPVSVPPPVAPTAPDAGQAQAAAFQTAINEVGTVPAPSAIVPPTPAAPAEVPIAPVAPVAAPSPHLVIDDGKDVILPADKREIIIGREDPISGIFPEVDLTPFGGETGGVSRQHARLNHDAGQWTVTDLNSTNYTRVDGAKIEPNVAVPLKDGARLQFGRVAMTFHE